MGLHLGTSSSLQKSQWCLAGKKSFCHGHRFLCQVCLLSDKEEAGFQETDRQRPKREACHTHISMAEFAKIQIFIYVPYKDFYDFGTEENLPWHVIQLQIHISSRVQGILKQNHKRWPPHPLVTCDSVTVYFETVAPDSVVCIPTGYGLEGPGIGSWWRRTKFSELVQTGPGAHPAFCTMGTGSFPGVKRTGRGVNHPPHLAPRLKKKYSYTSTPPPQGFMACSRVNFAFYLYISTLTTVPPVGSNMNLRDQVAKWQRWAAAANVIHFWRRSLSLGNILLFLFFFFFFFFFFFLFFFFMLHDSHGSQWPTGSTVS